MSDDLLVSSPIRICGVPDHFGTEQIAWPTTKLTWTIMDNIPGVPFEDHRDCAALAMQQIMDVCGLTLEYSQNGRTANIRMYAGKIDGPGGTLAWSELYSGGKNWCDQKYDTSERWYAKPGVPPQRNQISLPAVKCHEVCHALSLNHGGDDLMAPYYNPQWLKPGPWTIAQLLKFYPRKTPSPPANVRRIILNVSGEVKSARIIGIQ